MENVLAQKEFEETGITTRMVVVHNPFTHQLGDPFNIEEDLYRKWAAMLKENLKPDLMLCGHIHKNGIYEPGCDFDQLGQPCPLVVGSERISEKHHGEISDIIGCGLTFGDDITVTFTGKDGEVLSARLPKKK